MNIGNVFLDFSRYIPEKDIYSDGDIENELLDIIKNHREEVLKKDNRWAILYYLSEERKNILRWYPFEKGKKLLEIGTGCGAITDLFCKKDLIVKGVESSKRRATITAYRNIESKNLTISVGDFMNMDFSEKYDYITLIGVLEYAKMFIGDEEKNPYEIMLNRCREYLTESGILFIAIENRLGIKYWAGAAEDHTGKVFDGLEGYPNNDKVRTFSKNELQELVNRSGFKNIEWYYPYPDYKLPNQIFSDEFLPTGEFLFPDICAYDNERLTFFDEKRVIKNLADSKNFAEFSNSFLLICRKEFI